MNAALANPRRHCFIRTHHALITAQAGNRFPTPPETSERICALAGTEPMPDFFASMRHCASKEETHQVD